MTDRDRPAQNSSLAPTMAATGDSGDPRAPRRTLPAGGSGAARQSEAPLSAGKLLQKISTQHSDRYVFKRGIGAGGIGKVDLAHDTHLGRDVAIKRLLPQFASYDQPTGSGHETPTATDSEVRFLSEARITGQLEHPGIVPVYEMARRADGRIYYAMKRVQGTTLTAEIRDKELLDRLALLPNFLEVCNAVAFAHSKGVVHRDLKPENIMLGEFGETIVLDWGLARKDDSDDVTAGELARAIETLKKELEARHADEGMPLGTPQYMPPEQARGALDEVDERSDVYALGAILYEILTGQPPFTGRSPYSVILAVLDDPPESPRSIDDGVPAELAAIALKALAKKKEERYPSAGALAEDIRRWQRGGWVRSYEYSLPDLLKKWVLQHRRSLAAALVLLLTVGGALWGGRLLESRRRARLERSRQTRVLAEARELVASASNQGRKSVGWFDVYLLRLISLDREVTEPYLLTQLDHPNELVRKMVIRALGGMRSAKAVRPLLHRLEHKLEPTENMVVEIIKTLGVIGDPAANTTVQKIRWQAGQFSTLWSQTTVAYTMIPAPSRPDLDQMSTEELHLHGKALYNKGHPRASVRYFEAVIARSPRDFRPYNMLAIVHRSLENNELAIKYVTQSIQLDAKNAYYGYNTRGLLYRKVEKYKLALADFNAALAIRKGWTSALNNRGILYDHMGNVAAAERDFKQAIATNPRSRTYKFNLADHYLDQGDRVQAMRYARLSLAESAQNVNSNLLLANIHLDGGRFAEAKVILDRLFELQPQHTRLLHSYLLFHFLRRDTAKVRRTVQLLKGVMRPTRYTLKNLTAGHFLLGQWSSGLAVSRRSYRHQTTNDRTRLYNLARRLPLLIQTGQVAEYRRLARPLLAQRDRQWIDHLTLLLLGERSPESLEKRAFTTERRFELDFYAGLKYLMDGQRERARARLKLARQRPFLVKVEWLYAEALLRRL